jgi:hypothetical protein
MTSKLIQRDVLAQIIPWLREREIDDMKIVLFLRKSECKLFTQKRRFNLLN